jgi:DNA-binding beta-propeller fold protein YncE
MKKTIFLLLFAFANISFGLKATAQTYVADKTIPLPGNGGYDYVFIDQDSHTLYASHGTAVNVVDLQTEKVTGTISGGMKSVHGIAIAPDLNRGFVSDSKANAVFAFDTKTLQILKAIPLTGTDADGIMYDPYSKKVIVFEGDSHAGLVIDPQAMAQVGSIELPGGPEFAVSDGKGLIYNNIEDKNSMVVIDAKTWKVTRTFPLEPCGGPTGLAMDKANNRLFTVCRENKGMSVVDAASGKVIQTLPIGSGVDAVVYDAANKLVIASNADGTATVFKQNSADSYTFVQTVKTQYRAKTMAIDLSTHKIYFSVADYQTGTRTQVPDTFKLLVYKLQ